MSRKMPIRKSSEADGMEREKRAIASCHQGLSRCLTQRTIGGVMASGHPVVTIAVPCELSSQRRAQTLGFNRLPRKLQEAMTTSPRFEI